jgi:hypothetical protein
MPQRAVREQANFERKTTRPRTSQHSRLIEKVVVCRSARDAARFPAPNAGLRFGEGRKIVSAWGNELWRTSLRRELLAERSCSGR